MITEEFIGEFIGYTLVLIIVILLLIKLLKIIYKTYIVKVKLYKIIKRTYIVGFNDPYDYKTYYYSFKTKKGDEKSKAFDKYAFIKKGQSRLIFYSEDKDKLVGKFKTPFILATIIIFLFLGLSTVSIETCLISSIVIILTIIFFIINYNKKYSNFRN